MKNLVNRKELDISNHQVIKITNSTTTEFLDTVPNSTEEDVDIGVKTIQVAQKWIETPITNVIKF